MNYTPVCALEEIPAQSSKSVSVDGVSVLLCNHNGSIYALENRCTHQNNPLEGGRVRGGYVSCPLHGVRFKLDTGEPVGALTRIPVRTFAVQVEDGVVSVSSEPPVEEATPER